MLIKFEKLYKKIIYKINNINLYYKYYELSNSFRHSHRIQIHR
jgi:hypothetical protein